MRRRGEIDGSPESAHPAISRLGLSAHPRHGLAAVDAAKLRLYIDAMYRLICRRFVALGVAYALALAPVLPLLAAFAWAADLGPAGVGEICASKRSDARSPADAPNGHGAACLLGTGCALQDCSAAGLPAPDGATAAIRVLGPARFFIHPVEAVLGPRDGGPHFARAPPRVRG
jgi:hypothetical protein